MILIIPSNFPTKIKHSFTHSMQQREKPMCDIINSRKPILVQIGMHNYLP